MSKEIEGVIKKIIIVVGSITAVVLLNPVSCVGPSQRGVKILFGAVKESVLSPGIQIPVPLVERIQKYSIVPQEITMEIPVWSQGQLPKTTKP
jgi:regulator of protease activity HflC (stomatin/prohibitin superfamily)